MIVLQEQHGLLHSEHKVLATAAEEKGGGEFVRWQLMCNVG